ncbi:hypothetical protein WBG78_27595 [Chryseolinea sp. T2]|uniref:hypothetical protein n=1 Tax=Chryseolinea sp. T2 TaxID=3129255 RepID=UPI003076B82B
MREYFQSYRGYFWQWEDGGNVVAIPQAATIAYTDYVGSVIEKLSRQGLPPFGSLLLANIAMNHDGSASLDVVYQILCNALKTSDDVDLSRAIRFLKLLASLPQPFKESDRRILVLQTIFERSHNNLSVKNSQSVLEHYRKGLVGDPQTEFHRSVFTDDFRTLSLLESRFPDVESIINRISAIPDPKQIVIDFEERTGNDETAKVDLIDELISNHKTHEVGSLIRWLWGGLNVPVHSSLPSQQPLGGISDLTNKGDFDKLLISEFAHDDLSFLSRLANNEALYIHREIPPAHNNLKRLVLIDATLKNWGTPRLMAFSVMLAIARHPKTDIPCSAFVLGGEKYYPIAKDNVDQIIDALAILDGNLHPGKSLEAFLNDAGNLKNNEIFLVTEKSTMKHPGLMKVINDHPGKIHYVMLTDALGTIDVYKRERSIRHIQHIQIPLEKLWAKKKQHSAKKEVQIVTKFNVDYPILLRNERKVKSILPAPDGEVFQITTERSVLRHFHPASYTKRGWDLVCRDLPYKTDVHEIGINDSGQYILLLFNAQNRDLTLINLQHGEKQSIVFDQWRHTEPSFIFDSGKFYHCNQRGLWSISTTGEVEEADIFDRKKFAQRKKVLDEAALKYTSNYGVFKNVSRVYINTLGELVFNVHALGTTRDGAHLKLIQATDQNSACMAVAGENNIFTFKDGSSVEINRTGLVILRSSDRMIPAIYLPTTLDSALGIATTDEFAGNDYYFKEPTYQVILESAGSNSPEALIRLLERRGRPFSHVLDVATHCPVALISFCTHHEAIAVQELASNLGAKVDVVPTGGQAAHEMKKIPVLKFFHKHVGRFINTIVNYGNKNI